MGSRQFHLGDILSVTTGRLVSPRHLVGVRDLVEQLTGVDMFLPRAEQVCRPALLRQHPQLAYVAVPDHLEGEELVQPWLAQQVQQHGEYLPVHPIPAADHTQVNPMDELNMNHPHLTVAPRAPSKSA